MKIGDRVDCYRDGTDHVASGVIVEFHGAPYNSVAVRHEEGQEPYCWAPEQLRRAKALPGARGPLYGALPKDFGPIALDPVEMMFWLYCPVFVPGSGRFYYPPNLQQFQPLVQEAVKDFRLTCMDIGGVTGLMKLAEMHVYLTAKRLYVSGTNAGNRPGWHSDGFGTDDINYIWYDREPTEFLDVGYLYELSSDCDESQIEMQEVYEQAPSNPIRTYPNKHLLRLDPSVIHRVPPVVEPGMRTFVKVSISRHRYDLAGNSINHELGDLWPMVERKAERNHPASATA